MKEWFNSFIKQHGLWQYSSLVHSHICLPPPHTIIAHFINAWDATCGKLIVYRYIRTEVDILLNVLAIFSPCGRYYTSQFDGLYTQLFTHGWHVAAFYKLSVITGTGKLLLLDFPKTSHYFHFLFLRIYHSGSNVGQEQEFRMAAAGKRHFELWYFQFNYTLLITWVMFWDSKKWMQENNICEWYIEFSLYITSVL